MPWMSVFLAIGLFLGYTITCKAPSGRLICHPQTQPNITYHMSIFLLICPKYISKQFLFGSWSDYQTTFRKYLLSSGLYACVYRCSFIIEHRGENVLFMGVIFFSFPPIYSAGKRKWKNMSNGVEYTINYIYFWQAADLCTAFTVEWGHT